MSDIKIMEIAEQIAKGELSMEDSKVKEAETILRELASSVDGKNEIAQVIGMYIDRVFNKFDIAPYLCEYRNFALGDKPEFRLRKKGIKAYWIAPNSTTPKSRNFQETLTMEFETISARPEVYLEEIEAGRIQGFVELVRDTQNAIQDGISAKVFTLLGQFYNLTKNPEFYAQDTTSLTAETLDDAIDTIFYETGLKPTVIADYMLSQQITKFDGFTDEAKEEIRMNGKLGTYRGATILGLPKVLDPVTEQNVVPTNKLFVCSQKIGYAGTYGTSKTGQETNIDNWTWNVRLDKNWGMTVTEPKGLFVIEIV